MTGFVGRREHSYKSNLLEAMLNHSSLPSNSRQETIIKRSDIPSRIRGTEKREMDGGSISHTGKEKGASLASGVRLRVTNSTHITERWHSKESGQTKLSD